MPIPLVVYVAVVGALAGGVAVYRHLSDDDEDDMKLAIWGGARCREDNID